MGSRIRVAILALAFVLMSAAYLITLIPAGPTIQVKAEVVSRASRSGPTGNTGILLCALDSGRQVSVESPSIATVQTGDKVLLDAYNRYFIQPKYTFAGKLISH